MWKGSIDWREKQCLPVKVDKKVFRAVLGEKNWTWEQIIGQIIIRSGVSGKSEVVTIDEYKIKNSTTSKDCAVLSIEKSPAK